MTRTNGFALKTVYITDRDDDGKLFGRLVGSLEEDEILVGILVAPHLVVLSDDGLTRNGVPETPAASVQEER